RAARSIRGAPESTGPLPFRGRIQQRSLEKRPNPARPCVRAAAERQPERESARRRRRAAGTSSRSRKSFRTRSQPPTGFGGGSGLGLIERRAVTRSYETRHGLRDGRGKSVGLTPGKPPTVRPARPAHSRLHARWPVASVAGNRSDSHTLFDRPAGQDRTKKKTCQGIPCLIGAPDPET